MVNSGETLLLSDSPSLETSPFSHRYRVLSLAIGVLTFYFDFFRLNAKDSTCRPLILSLLSLHAYLMNLEGIKWDQIEIGL